MAVGAVQPFAPSQQNAGVSLAVTTTSASVTLPVTGSTLLLYNAGTVAVFVALAATASLAGLPLPPGTTTLIECGPYSTVLSAITATSTATLFIQRGAGSAR
jgi:uncharacterized membrane protein